MGCCSDESIICPLFEPSMANWFNWLNLAKPLIYVFWLLTAIFFTIYIQCFSFAPKKYPHKLSVLMCE